jgi:gas vesicle protein
MRADAAMTADDVADSIRAMIDRVADAKLTKEMARVGQDVAALLAERGVEVGDRASEAWRDSRPMRRDAAKRLARATRDAARVSDRTWRSSVRPALRDLWTRRTVAMGAAGAAVPAGKELVDTAAVRLGLRQREARHWGAFFLGLLIGAIGGAIAALLLAPRRGDEIRRELSVRADEVRQELATRADEIVTRAKDQEWVPIFQRDELTNGQPADAMTGQPADALSDVSGSVQDAAADAGTASEEASNAAADATAESINEAFDPVDRESRS